MLDGLDAVAWSSLTHAYGRASDVPGLIRDLAYDRAETRRAAMGKLYGNIWHQGTVYEATGFAVPFLIELVESISVQERDRILVFLAHLARGNSYLEVHRPLFRQTTGEESADKKAELDA